MHISKNDENCAILAMKEQPSTYVYLNCRWSYYLATTVRSAPHGPKLTQRNLSPYQRQFDLSVNCHYKSNTLQAKKVNGLCVQCVFIHCVHMYSSTVSPTSNSDEDRNLVKGRGRPDYIKGTSYRVRHHRCGEGSAASAPEVLPQPY